MSEDRREKTSCSCFALRGYRGSLSFRSRTNSPSHCKTLDRLSNFLAKFLLSFNFGFDGYFSGGLILKSSSLPMLPVGVTDTPPTDHHRLPSKRKLEDYQAEDDDDDLSVGSSPSFKLRKDETTSWQNPPPSTNSEGSFVKSTESIPESQDLAMMESEASVSRDSSILSRCSQVQFFVRMISIGNSLVLKGHLNDTVEVVHEKIASITGIPMKDQRLIYRGKHLYWEKTLAEYSIQNDAGLQLVGRMRATKHPVAWRVISEFVSIIFRICRKDNAVSTMDLKVKLDDYIAAIPNPNKLRDLSNGCQSAIIDYFKVFVESRAPQALVMLYMSSEKVNKICAENCIRCFVNWAHSLTRQCERAYFATTVLEFCRLLSYDQGDVMYLFCRHTLGTMIQTVPVFRELAEVDGCRHYILFHEIVPFLEETLKKVLNAGAPTVGAKGNDGPLERDVSDLTAFLHPFHKSVEQEEGPIFLPLSTEKDVGLQENVLLYSIYTRLYVWAGNGLNAFEQFLAANGKAKMDGCISGHGWSLYLVVLKELHKISKLYNGVEHRLWAMICNKKAAFCALVAEYANPVDNSWLIDHKDVLDFESRRRVAMLMFPALKEDYDEMHEMLIDRSQLLAESFEYILRAEVRSLHAGLFMEFKNEEATGPGVLREWFFLVSQEIFNPQNALFNACPHDRRRFFPNPASRVHPLHLDYFTFAGRIIALALMHKIHIGIVLDRSFILQLAGRGVSLEDVKDADPYMYSSCKKILEMDAELVDSDVLGLTFVSEFDELGSREAVELCPSGNTMVVNSKNRYMYVDLLINHRFVTSVHRQVSRFARGFGEILSDVNHENSFFQCLELEDLDSMLSGCGGSVSVEDWKAHTEYNGYKKSDRQIIWFWKVVGRLSDEQKRTLLFFWTSIKYLPVEGFKGLPSRLYIYKSDSEDRLPSSSTCFYRLCIPPYKSLAMMQSRINFITQEHVGCSFGNW